MNAGMSGGTDIEDQIKSPAVVEHYRTQMPPFHFMSMQ